MGFHGDFEVIQDSLSHPDSAAMRQELELLTALSLATAASVQNGLIDTIFGILALEFLASDWASFGGRLWFSHTWLN